MRQATYEGKYMNVLTKPTRTLITLLLTSLLLAPVAGALADDDQPVLPSLSRIKTIASTVPANGDLNPYGVAQVRRTIGTLRAGHILVSNFNDSGNFQGTGTTIVDIGPDGGMSLFAALDAAKLPGSCPGGVGLTTALVVLDQGWVIVGSLPTASQGTVFSGPGCLIVLDSMGKPVETFYGSLINGPWDMTAAQGGAEAKLFVTNVLNGTVAAGGAVVHGGTVTRLNLKLTGTLPALESITVVGSGFPERTDPAALVIGPTGVGLRASCMGDGDDCMAMEHGDQDADDRDSSLLYVADTLGNRVAVIDRALTRTSSAGTGRTLSSGGSLNGPLGLVLTPRGTVLTVNSGDGLITEISPHGAQLARKQLDNTGSPPGAGALFGLAFDPAAGVYFVDDASNTLNLLHH
ncbi:MAG: hypothetical protein JO158_07595 [Gammaproteobacteria bacterium]|nr:hypothetical protein [Gammaproteobacteria bacterium]MBV9726068.1 hypothetical protein [Gammaproteobacteria bacterium]